MKFENLDNGHVRLLENYYVDIPPIGRVLVPKGFESDGASIPRLVWPIVGPPIRGKHFRAAVVHDCLCDYAARRKCYGLRIIADAVFYYLLAVDRIPYWKRAAMYLAVRFWGRYTYKPRRNDS